MLPAAGASGAAADLFYIHPTTTLSLAKGNASAGADEPMDRAALANQASVFGACCRIYAPRYRQATLRGLGSGGAIDVAYADVDDAFADFLVRIGPERPFVIAGHSQGAALGLRLIGERIAGSPLLARMVVAYLPGAFVPRGAAGIGVAACGQAEQTGCIASWNTASGQRRDEALLHAATFWSDGAWRRSAGAPALCTNPLDWHTDGAAPASANLGSLPLRLTDLRGDAPALVPHLTGAACLPNGALSVTIPRDAPAGFHNLLAGLTGSEHLLDYNLFYANIAQNVALRIAAWGLGLRPSGVPGAGPWP